MTPLEIASKCVKKLKEAIASTMRLRQHAAHEIEHQRKSGEQEYESDQRRGDEGDHLVARGGGQAHADGEKSARHQEAADVGGDDGAVVRAAEIVDRDPDRKGQRQSDAREAPGGQKFARPPLATA